MYCRECGKEVRDGAAYCPHCGAALGGAEPEEYEDEEYDEPRRGGKKGANTGVIIAIIAAVAVVLVAGIFAFTSLTHNKQEAQIAQMEAQQAKAEAEAAEAEMAKQEAELAKQEAEQAKQEAEQAKQEAEKQTQQQAQQKAQQQQSSQSSGKSGGYLWPTDTQYITPADLSGYTKDNVAAIRNEIYARHGYAFQSSTWKNYFANKSWYVRDESCTQSVAESRMNKIEKANLATIVQYEKDMGWK